MPPASACASAGPNIALVKYWGNRDEVLRLPSNGSISLTLAGLTCRTRVTLDESLPADVVTLNGQPAAAATAQRVTQHLDLVRKLAGLDRRARVESQADFPAGAGLASSAAAFAALSLAAASAAGLDLSPADLSRLARRGSGSACRSVLGGFVEWRPADRDQDSYAEAIAPPGHWPLADVIAIVAGQHKPVGSTEGHRLAGTSPLQAERVADAPRRLDACRQAILERDFDTLAELSELDSNWMHAVMMTSRPPLLYWRPATVAVMQAVVEWRRSGTPVFYTIDAGPNVHCLTPAEAADNVAARLRELDGVQEVLRAQAGGPARLADPS